MQIDTGIVRRLVDRQFPQWAGLPLTPVDPGGSDHVIHRLGDDLSVRLPRHDGAIGQAVKEMTWLPRIAPHLPLAVPVPVAVGEPDLGYPWPWAVARWLDGDPATEELGESDEAAIELAGFLKALRELPGEGPARRTLEERDAGVRERIARAGDVFDARELEAVWSAALEAPPGPDRWCHGDFHTGNLLTSGGRLSAVIDFGGLGSGDPACDLMMAFTLLSPGPRAVFRDALGADDAMWARGRGWALAGGITAYVSYARTRPRVAAATTRQIAFVLQG